MVKEIYIPEQGDIVWLDFDPQLGHEQTGNRPALVMTPKFYNVKSGLCLFVPITSKVKGYPFEIKVNTQKIDGVALSDQIKSLDFKSRNVKFCDKLDDEAYDKIAKIVTKLLER